MKEQDQFFFDVFAIAMEGGIGYWSECTEYRWFDLDEDGNYLPRVKTFHATIMSEGEEYVITRQTLEHAIERLKAGEVKGLHESRREMILEAHKRLDAGLIDAGYADCIVQIGIFGFVVFG